MARAKSDRLLLLIAIVCGAGATATAFLYLNSLGSAIPTRTPAHTLEIVVARHDLGRDHVLKRGDLEVRSIPDQPEFQDLFRQAYKQTELQALPGRRINAPVPAGAPLLYASLTPMADFDIPEGRRAMAIEVSAANALAGLLVPGDHVDVLVTYPLPPPEPPPAADTDDAMVLLSQIMKSQMAGFGVAAEWDTAMVLEDVPVLAVGQRLSGSRQQLQTVSEMLSHSGGGATTITLDVTVEDAVKLLRTTGGGGYPVTLLLRSKTDGVE